MSHTFDAIFEGGVLRPLTAVPLPEHQLVRVVVQTVVDRGEVTPDPNEDPLAGLTTDTGIEDLAENFDDYRLGRRQP